MSPEEFASYLRDDLPKAIESISFSKEFAEIRTTVAIPSIQEHFANTSTPDGETWPPRKDDLPHPLLVLSGDLLEAASGGEGSILQITDDEMTMGIDGQVIPYAARQNYGYTGPDSLGRVFDHPPREYEGLDEQAIDKAEEIIANGFLSKIFPM